MERDIRQPSMAPNADRINTLQNPQHIRRQFSASSINNPLKDKQFITIVVALVAGALVFLIIVVLILCLYRENSPLKRCLGRGRKKSRLDPEDKSLDSLRTIYSNPTAASSTNSRIALAPAAAPVAMAPIVWKDVNLNAASGGRGSEDGRFYRQDGNSLDLSMIPFSKLIPFLPTPTSSPEPPPRARQPTAQRHPPARQQTRHRRQPSISPSLARVSRSLSRSTRTRFSGAGATVPSMSSIDSWASFAPNTRRLVLSGKSFREYSWLLDIIHDHTAGLFRNSRLSGPYKLARVPEMEEQSTLMGILATSHADTASRGAGEGLPAASVPGSARPSFVSLAPRGEDAG